MWYRLKYTDGTLSACVWPFPRCFEKTDDTQKGLLPNSPSMRTGLPGPRPGGRTVRGRCPAEAHALQCLRPTGRNCRGGYGSCPVPGAEDAPVRFVADTPAVHWLIRNKSSPFPVAFWKWTVFFVLLPVQKCWFKEILAAFTRSSITLICGVVQVSSISMMALWPRSVSWANCHKANHPHAPPKLRPNRQAPAGSALYCLFQCGSYA